MFGILERAKQFAKDAKNYISSIVGSDNETKPAQPTNVNKTNCVLNTENKTVDTPTDKFEKQTVNNKTNTKVKKNTPKPSKQNKTEQKFTKIVTDKDIINKGKEIDKLKEEYKISDEEYYEIILPRVGYSKNEFKRLNNNDKMQVLDAISGAMKVFALDKYKDNPDINMTEIIADAAADFNKALLGGGIKTFKEFDKEVKPYIAKINKEFKAAKSEDEKIDVLIQNRLTFAADLNKQRAAELANCKTEEQRAEINSKYDNQLEAFEGYLQTHFIADNGKPEVAYMSSYLRSADNMANGYERAVKSFSCEVRSAAAGTFTHGNRIKQAQIYSELGDPISAKTYGDATEVVTQFMGKEQLEQYEKDAYLFKKEYYKNPGKYKFISEEYLTQEAVRVAVGATINKNLTASEKAAFLKAWNEHAQEFSDYDTVRGSYYSAINEYISKNPEIKKLVDDIKAKIKEQSGDNPDVPRAAQKRYDSPLTGNVTGNKTNIEKTAYTSKATPQKLELALYSNPFEVVRKQYSKNSDKEFADVILHNPKLKNYRPHIKNCLNTLSVNDLHSMVFDCSTDAFLFVLRNISPDKAGRLYDLSKGEKCYAARKLGEVIVEENRANEVA